jgi:hypothetical protein
MTSAAIDPMQTFGVAPTVDKVVPGAVTRVREGDLAGPANMILGVSLLALAATGAGYFIVGSKQFLVSYLTGYMYTLGIVLGALFFVLVQHVTRAGWSVGVRRIAENAMANFPLMLVLFLPIAFGYREIYHHWVEPSLYDPESANFDAVLNGKRGYLNPTFFFVRAVLYFAIWIGLSAYFYGASRRQDDTGDPGLTVKMAARAAPGIVLFGLTTTFAAFDWIMSIDPHWFSTMFGVCYFAGGAMGLLATLSLLCLLINRAGYLKEFVNAEHYHDIGKLLFAFMVFWTYVSFSQYMLIWYANLPEETGWYMTRAQNGWGIVGTVLVVGHFFVPFAFLMSRHAKRNRTTLAIGAVLLLVMHWFDMQYQIQPTDMPVWNVSWLDITAVIGIFGLFFAMTLRRTIANPLVPERDPRLAESVRFHNI